MFKQLGLEAVEVENGQEAVDQVNKEDFDLILMDMQMPVMDGIVATKLIRESGKTVPIIALTANCLNRHLREYHEAGCDQHISKPFKKNEIYDVVAKYLNPIS